MRGDIGADGHGQARLRVEIDHQHAPAFFRQRGGDIERAGGFGGAAFLIEEGDEASHREGSTRAAGGPSVRTDVPCNVARWVGMDKRSPIVPCGHAPRTALRQPRPKPAALQVTHPAFTNASTAIANQPHGSCRTTGSIRGLISTTGIAFREFEMPPSTQGKTPPPVVPTEVEGPLVSRSPAPSQHPSFASRGLSAWVQL